MDLITIVIAAYNCEQYIDKCISSVVSQSYTEWELIVINDGSNDATWSHIQNWVSNYPTKIKAINTINQGVVLARERALHQAEGTYLLFLDADDYLPISSLQNLYFSIVKKNADLAIGSYSLFWENVGKISFINHIKDFESPKDCIRYCLDHGETFLPIKLYKTELFKKFVHIPSDVIIQEDTIGIIQYLTHIDKVCCIQDNVYFYVKHSGTVTSTFTIRHQKSLLNVSEFLHAMQSESKFQSCFIAVQKHIINNVYTCLSNKYYKEVPMETLENILGNWMHCLYYSRKSPSTCLKIMATYCYYKFPFLKHSSIAISEFILSMYSAIKKLLCRILH